MTEDERADGFALAMKVNGDAHGPKWACLEAIKGLRGHDATVELRDAIPVIEALWPGRVTEIGCDDDHAAGSTLWLITHEDPETKRWIFGDVTILYIAQLGGADPACLSVNDAQQRQLRAALKTIALRRRRCYTHEEYDDEDFAETFGDDP